MFRKADLHGYQQRTVTAFYENAMLQAVLPMGAGKTAAALTAIAELIEEKEIRAALVLAPKKVAQLVWPAEVKNWEHLTGLRVRVAAGTPLERQLQLSLDADVYIVGIDNVQWLVDDVLAPLNANHHLFDCLVIDESSRFKNPRSKRARALMKVRKRFRNVWGLTGTPRPNGFEDLFKPLSLITDGKLWGRSFDVWREQRFIRHKRNDDGTTEIASSAIPESATVWKLRDEWHERTIADINKVSITIDDADMPELPELQQVVHWVDLPPRARAAYDTMERKLFAEIRKGTILAANAGVAAGKLAQAAQGFMYGRDNTDVEHLHTEKADLLVELLEDLQENALIAYEFVEDLRVLRDLYGNLPHMGSGTKPDLAAEYEARWNAGALRMMAMHPASAGHGLNLQHGGRHMFWYGMTWSAELFDQTTKRFHRPGQKRHCFNHLILARDTVDEVKLSRVAGKMSMQDAFMKYMLRKV